MDILCQNDLSLITSTKSSSEAYNKGPKISTSFGLRLEKWKALSQLSTFQAINAKCRVSIHPSSSECLMAGRYFYQSCATPGPQPIKKFCQKFTLRFI